MLKGFRWQLLALLASAALFAVTLLVRQPATPQSTPAVNTPVVTVQAESSPTPQALVQSTAQIPQAPDAETQPPASYREGLVGSVQRLNPLFADLNPVDRDITALIFEGLMRINQYGEPVGALAERWIISSDGLEYVFFLRQDVLWQDGVPFTANDVVFTMLLLRSADFPGSAALRDFWRTVETEALEPHVVRFRLTQPLGGFLDALRIGILPEHALAGTSAARLAAHPFNLTPVGTGPYQLEATRSLTGQRIDIVDLRAAPVYRRRLSDQSDYAIERISFHLYADFDAALAGLRTGAIDGLAARNRSERAALLDLPNVVVHTAIDPAFGVVIFNWQRENLPVFREDRVRRALEVGSDVSALIERYLPNLAIPANSPLLPGSWAYASDLPAIPFDPAQALQLLETAGLQASDEGLYFSFALLTPDDPALLSIVQELVTQWSQYNIGVTVEAVDNATYTQRLDSGDFDVALVELSLSGGADPDVYGFWHEGQYPEGQNYGGVDDRRISELLERARRDPNGIHRMALYRQFQQEFVSRSIALPLYYPLYGYATIPTLGDVQLGFIGTPQDRFATLADWRLIGTTP